MSVQILPPEVSNKIAAGEVVERPASVIKELVENAIDAGSSNIQVDIRAGGKRLIRVSDNGVGMSTEDATLAVERHATSKLTDIGDLQQIQTFGFRGEALPSIASVSKLDLQTRRHDDVEGTQILLEGGVVQSTQESGCSPGTQISVNNLFYNVPARLKFLKTETTEMNHITNQITWAALAHPKIRFSLQHNQKSVIDVRPCDDLIDRIRLLYGKEMAENLIQIEAGLPNFQVQCWIGKPDITKSTRNWQLFFLNRRPIRSKILSGAMTEATRQTMPKGRHAVAFVFLTIAPEEVDVNVHPAKIEVRFRDERGIYSQIVRLLSKGIYQQKFIPSINHGSDVIDTPARIESAPQPSDSEPVSPVSNQRKTQQTSSPIEPSQSPPAELAESTTDLNSPVAVTTSTSTEGTKPTVFPVRPEPSDLSVPSLTRELATPDKELPAIDLLVQPPERQISAKANLELLDFNDVQLKANLFNTYILAEGRDRIFVIDQHVASERVLYEQLVTQLQSNGIPIQGLLLPVTLEITSQQLGAFEQHQDLFRQLGFEIEKFGGQTLLVRGIPSMVPTRLVATVVTDLIDHLSESVTGDVELLEVHDQAMTMLSCRSAVKAGDRLTMEEMIHLVKELSQAEHPFNCPHARPIIIEITQRELETRFKRR